MGWKGAAARAATVGGLTLVVLTMALTSTSNAVLGSAAVTVKVPPYTGASSPFASTGVTPCAKAGFSKSPSFSMKTGFGGFGVGSTSEKLCAKPFAGIGAYSEGYIDPQMELAFSVSMPTGTHSLQVPWNLAYTDSGHYATSGKCGKLQSFVNDFNYTNGTGGWFYDNYSGKEAVCTVEADVFLYLEEAELEDLSTGKTVLASGCATQFCFKTLVANDTYNTNESGWEFYSYTTCYLGSCTTSSGVFSLNYSFAGPTTFSGSGTLSYTDYFNGTFVKTHKYALIYDFFGDSICDAQGFSSASSGATYNAQTLGNGLDFPSMTIV